MKKYGVILVKGDTVTTLETCGSREAVIVASQLHKRRHSRDEGRITAVQGAFDEYGRLDRSSFRIL